MNSKAILPALQPEEKAVIEVKYKSPAIAKLQAFQQDAQIKILFVKTQFITGWQLPENEDMLRILRDQLQKLITESYPTINSDEFEYAMRTYGTRIKDWGKILNLSLIREALDEYLTARASISSFEERANKPEKAISPGPVDWSDEWERLKERKKEGKELIITTAIYDWLDRTGKLNLTTEQKKQLMNQALEKMISEYEAQKLIGFDRGIINDLKKLKTGEWKQNISLSNKIINRAKIIAINDLL